MQELMVIDEAIEGEYKLLDNNSYDKIKLLFIETKRSNNTKATYRNSLSMLETFIGKSMDSVTMEDAHSYSNHLKGKYESLHSIKLHINVAKSFYQFAMKVQYINYNPFAIITPDTPAEVTHKRMIDVEDVMKLINAPASIRDQVMLRTAYVTGMRASELTSVTWGDINSNGVLTVIGKGQKQRAVTLSDKTIDAINSTKPQDATDTDRIFPISRVWVHKIIKKAAALAGITEDVSIHWLRHAHASHSIDAGANLVDVRDTLGHTSIATTNKYLHGKRNNSSSLKLGL